MDEQKDEKDSEHSPDDLMEHSENEHSEFTRNKIEYEEGSPLTKLEKDKAIFIFAKKKRDKQNRDADDSHVDESNVFYSETSTIKSITTDDLKTHKEKTEVVKEINSDESDGVEDNDSEDIHIDETKEIIRQIETEEEERLDEETLQHLTHTQKINLRNKFLQEKKQKFKGIY